MGVEEEERVEKGERRGRGADRPGGPVKEEEPLLMSEGGAKEKGTVDRREK